MNTEKEAKKKWCPVRAEINAKMGIGPSGPDDIVAGCLASGCMMWK